MSWLSATWALGPAIAAFVVAAAVIALAGTRLAGTVDVLADRTGIGEAVAGATLLGATTSLPGLVVSGVAAADGNASLAVSNSVGGIAAQTSFIVAADFAYRRANLEHAAASVTNVFNSLLVVVLLAIVLVGVTSPPWTVAGVHPVTLLLIGAYFYGLRLARAVGNEELWQPRVTTETVIDEPDDGLAPGTTTGSLWVRFALLAAVIAVAGWVVGRSGLSIIAATGLSATLVGTFATSIVTSLPELVTAVAAVRAGALTLAVGGIIGGNTFDVLFVAVADVAYRDGSLYEAVAESDVFVIAWTILLVAIAGAGLVRRQARGIGFEGIAILVLYVLGAVVLASL